MSFSRPTSRWPLVDITDSNSATLPVTIQTSGRQAGTIGDPRIENALDRSAGAYIGYLDCETLRNDDWTTGGATVAVRLTTDQLAYPTFGGALGPYSPTNQPTYLYRGNRLEVDEAITIPDPQIRPGSEALSFITFAANMVTWIYMDKDGVVSLDVQAPATPAAPPAGNFALVGVTTDGVEIISLDYTGTPAHELRLDAIPFFFGTAVTFNAAATFTAGATYTGTINFNGAVFFNDNVTLGADSGDIITVPGTASFAELTTFSSGIQGPALGPVVLTQGATITAGKSITGDGTTSISTGALTSLGGATFGTTESDTMLVNATAVVPALGATSLKGVFNVLSAISGYAGTITSDATAVLLWSGSAQFNGRLNVGGGSSTTEGDLSKAGGHLQYNDGTNTHFVHKSLAGFVLGFGEALTPTPAANIIVDTSAPIAPLVAANLKITGTAWVQRDGAGDCTFSIEEVGGIGQLGTADPITVPDDAANDYKVVTFTRVRSAADTTPRIYRFKITGGGPNVTAINATVTVTEAP